MWLKKEKELGPDGWNILWYPDNILYLIQKCIQISFSFTSKETNWKLQIATHFKLFLDVFITRHCGIRTLSQQAQTGPLTRARTSDL